MRRPLLAVLLLLSPGWALGLPPVPTLRPVPSGPDAAGLRVCIQGDLRLRVDSRGRVRFLEYGRRFPDNLLSVSQSYDRAGRLTGITVRQTGFAGRVLDLRGTFDVRGRVVGEGGLPAPGLEATLRSYLRPIPRDVRC